ncbi:MAG: NAD(+)/NADH kinase [Thermovirga sp.]|nr:NAD(+)/NADH kinase [Thermovirga sp.]
MEGEVKLSKNSENINIGMLVNTKKAEAMLIAERLLRWSKAKGISMLFPPHEAHVLGTPETPDEEWKKIVDIAIVLGGDGTFLRAARYVVEANIPLYGINAGQLGFLSCGNKDDAEKDLELIVSGEYTIQSRRLLHGEIYRENSKKHQLFALNDLVVTKGSFARLVSLGIYVNGRHLTDLRADGVVISTPTGSTAYALSAGGPIVPPHVPCVILAPICAHTLYSRPMILSDEDIISIVPEGQNREIMLTQDGQLGYELLPGDRIDMWLDKEKNISIITLRDRDYYALLQEKFKWGHSYE